MKKNNILSSIFVYIVLFALMITSVNAVEIPANLDTTTNFAENTKIETSANGMNSVVDRKEEIRSGDYVSHSGRVLMVKELTQNKKELKINGVTAKTNLSIIGETDAQGKTKLTTMLRNGEEGEIMIMPDVASKTALERLRLKVCSAENNCTIELKDVGSGEEEKIQYEVQLERQSKILGMFNKRMHVTVDVDAQTGESKVHRPWWAFMATTSDK
jgi:hypothetical protein